MTRQRKELLAFNRGVISSRGLARIDIERMAMSADIQTNWMPRVLGSMMLRPGLEYINNTNGNNPTRMLPFTFEVDDQAHIEISDDRLRVLVDDALISRPTVSATITNPNFASDVTGWTDNDDVGGTSSWVNDATYGGVLSLVGDDTNAAIRTQSVTVTETGVEHALDIDVVRGTVTLRVGSTDGDDDYIAEAQLGRGLHKLAFTPTGTFWIQLSSTTEHEVWVTSVDMSPSGVMFFVSPWEAADLPKLRWDQSGDVIYLACDGVRQMKIERRAARSWSVVSYFPADGPFRVQNTGAITLTPSALSGQLTITASKALFKTAHATNYSLFRIASQGQAVSEAISAANTFSDPIRVVGKEDARTFGIVISGTFVATVTLQFAFKDDGPWTDQGTTWTAPISTNYTDGQDDQIIYYRIGVKTGEYTSGTATCELTYTGGSIEGIARINAYVSATSVTASALKNFGATDASKDWAEGEWSTRRGHPSAVKILEGRLWWGGLDRIWGSISDLYESFDDTQEGDAGPISRSIGSGPIRVIHWLLSLGRLIMGTSDNSANVAAMNIDGNNPLGARSNSFDEPLTPFNFNIKPISSKGVFVDRTKQRLYQLGYNIDEQDYKSLDLSIFAPDYNAAGIVQIAVQMKPDVRIHCVRADGTVGVLVFDRAENVICWCEMTSPGAGGLVEDVSVLPGVVEDQVYYVVKRTINSLTERHLCKWALESEAIGGTANKIADSFKVYSGAATTTPFTTELLHLRDEQVVVWADGVDIGLHTVSAAGALTLTTAASDVIAGLGYTAQFKSAKLGRLDGIGLLQHKNVQRLGFIAENVHHLGVQYGPDFDNLSDLPQVVKDDIVAVDTIHADYHEDDFPFGGEWDSDSRICLQAQAPRPCTILAAIADMESVNR